MTRRHLHNRGALFLSVLAIGFATFALVPTSAAPTGTSALAPPPMTAVPLRRFYHAGNDRHYYTVYQTKDPANGPGWQEEKSMGFAFPAATEGTVPLYVRYITGGLPAAKACGFNYFYTRDKSEADKVVAGGWAGNSVEAWVSATQVLGTVPLYRLYKPQKPGVAEYIANFGKGSAESLFGGDNSPGGRPCGDNNFYTIDANERTYVMQHGYQAVRTEAYVWTYAAATPSATNVKSVVDAVQKSAENMPPEIFFPAGKQFAAGQPVVISVQPNPNAQSNNALLEITQSDGTKIKRIVNPIVLAAIPAKGQTFSQQELPMCQPCTVRAQWAYENAPWSLTTTFTRIGFLPPPGQKDAASAGQYLVTRGCAAQKGKEGFFICPNPGAFDACSTYKKLNLVKGCSTK